MGLSLKNKIKGVFKMKTKVNFQQLISEKMEEERIDYVPCTDGEDAEFWNGLEEIMSNRKIPNGYAINPKGISVLSKILSLIEPIMMLSDAHAKITIKNQAFSMIGFTIEIECNGFSASNVLMPTLKEILNLCYNIDFYPRQDEKMIVGISVSDCLIAL